MLHAQLIVKLLQIDGSYFCRCMSHVRMLLDPRWLTRSVCLLLEDALLYYL